MSRVDVVLDLRGFDRDLDAVPELKSIWGNLEPVLAERSIETCTVRFKGRGTVTVHVIASDTARRWADAHVAIAGVMRRLTVATVCGLCEEEGRGRVSAFFRCRCPACQKNKPTISLCEAHARFLPGKDEPRHPAHTPRCRACRKDATFWCDGDCRLAWCDEHRVPHPTLADFSYCGGCHAERFPRCAVAGCPAVGALRCQHVGSPGWEPCGARACPEHGVRWQINGPNVEGVEYCPRHADIKSWPDDEILRQVLLATAARRRRHPGRGGPVLPRLRALVDIFGHAKQRSPSYPTLFESLRRAAAELALRGELGRQACEHYRTRTTSLQDELTQWQAGAGAFEVRVRQAFVDLGMRHAADAIVVTALRSPSPGGAPKVYWAFLPGASDIARKQVEQNLRKVAHAIGVGLEKDRWIRQ